MLTQFYRRHSAALLWLAALSFPFLFGQANAVRHNNNIETWLPRESPVRLAYEEFKRDFGVEEIILIGIDRERVSEPVAEGLCGRIDRLPGVRQCWSAPRLLAMMQAMGVSAEQARQRLEGLAVSKDGRMTALVATLSPAGLADRKAVVRDVRREIEYCQLGGSQSFLVGAPVVITELDHYGGGESNKLLFMVTLSLCLVLLYYWTRELRLSLAILGLTLWAIEFTVASFSWLGGEMNFILGALPVMVMVFTLEAALHVLHYYHVSRSTSDPLAEALRLCWKPCLVSMATTAIGLFSVSVTDIVPVVQFGYAAAMGAVVAMLTGLVFTPALVFVMPPRHAEESGGHSMTGLGVFGNWMLKHSSRVVAAGIAIAIVGGAGLLFIESKINALDFLPRGARVLSDMQRVETELTNIDSIEAVVDFQDSTLPFLARLEKVRQLEQRIASHSAVRHTMSAATFFPDPVPNSPLELMSLLRKAQSEKGQSEFVTDGQRRWRISARVKYRDDLRATKLHQELEALLAGEPIRFTGMSPLVEQAQREIFNGFWTSFLWAVVVIGIVMAIALWSPKTALLAMIPNVVPLCVVFGMLGWLGISVDIGMMMTGSIALGISVDGTFHFLVRYQEQLKGTRSRMHCVRVALLNTGGPIVESIVVSSVGMLALAMSNFAPTYRFGLLMATLLMATLAGSLVLLPCLLAMGRSDVKDASRPQTLPEADATPIKFIPAGDVA